MTPTPATSVPPAAAVAPDVVDVVTTPLTLTDDLVRVIGQAAARVCARGTPATVTLRITVHPGAFGPTDLVRLHPTLTLDYRDQE